MATSKTYSSPSLTESALFPLEEFMVPMVRSLFVLGRALLLGRTRLALENLALRQQLAVYHRSITRPVINNHDRILWVLLTRVWAGWREALIIVKPETFIRWHRLGFRLYWRWKCRGPNRDGRPSICNSSS